MRILGGGACSEATPTAAIIFRVRSHQKKRPTNGHGRIGPGAFTNALGHLALYPPPGIISFTESSAKQHNYQGKHQQATC